MSRTLRSLVALLTVVVTCNLVHAQDLRLDASIPFDPRVRTGSLTNGLKYYIRKNTKPEKRVEMRLAVNAGSILEDDDQRGLAHFAEHMAFNGTKKFPKQDLVNFLESNGVKFGAHLNAYTSFDETVYMLQLPTEKPEIVRTGMEVLSEWASNVTFDSAEIEKERGVVIEEWRLGRGAFERVSDKQYPIIFYRSQYAERLPIGKKEILESFSHETLRKFYRDWYRPDLMAVVVVGDVDPDQMESMIKEMFSTKRNPPSPRPRTKFELTEHDETLVSIATDKELMFPMFTMYYKRMPEHTLRTVADLRRGLVDQLYDGMFAHRLQELQRKSSPPFFTAFGSDNNFIGNSRAYTLTAILRGEALGDGVETILREAHRVAQTGFTETELERQKKEILNNTERAYNEREKSESRTFAQEYVYTFLRENPSAGVEYRLKAQQHFLPTITLAEVNALSRGRLAGRSKVMTLAAPENSQVKILTEAELRDALARAERDAHPAYDDRMTTAPLMASLPTSGKIVEVDQLDALGVTRWKLANGATVYLKPTDFKDDQIMFSATSPGGTSLVSDEEEVSAENASSIVDEAGIASFDATQLDKLLVGKTVTVSPMISELSEGFRGESSKKDLETLFQLTNLYFTQPRKDTAAANSYIARYKALIQNQSAMPENAFWDTLSVTLANYHPRRRPYTPETYDRIQLDRAFDFYRDRFADAGDFTFFFVGSFTLDEIKPMVERYLASLPSKGRSEMWRDVGVRAPKGVIKKSVHKGIEPQSQVSMVFHGPIDWSLEERHAMQSMAEAFRIKLREVLREEKGGVYGVGVSANASRYPRPEYSLRINFGCDPKRVDELVGEVMKQLDTLTSQPLPEIYINKVKEMQTKEFEVDLKENRFWLTRLQGYLSSGDDLNEIVQAKKRIARLTPELIHQTARKYFDRENYVMVTQYPEKME